MDGVPPVLEALMVVVCEKVLCLGGTSISRILSSWCFWGIGFAFGKTSGVGIWL